MQWTRTFLSAALVSFLGGCMTMGGMGNMSGEGATGHAHSGHSGHLLARPYFVEGSNGGLTLSLTFQIPGNGAESPIEARFRAKGHGSGDSDPSVWLQIRTPDDRVDRLRMDRADSSTAERYLAYYSFHPAGRYVVTADGRTGKGARERIVSVSIETEHNDDARRQQSHSSWHPSLVGGVSMIVLMTLMMVGISH